MGGGGGKHMFGEVNILNIIKNK